MADGRATVTESSIQSRILLALSKRGAKVFRMNTGNAWVGQVYSKSRETMTLKNPRRFRAGLTVGGSDIIGILPVIITPDMVGDTVGLFLAVEVKTPSGRATPEQLNFLKMVNATGGKGIIARSVDEALNVFDSGLVK